MISSVLRSAVPQAVPSQGASRIMLVPAAGRHEHEFISPENDRPRGVEFRPARLAKRQTAAWRGLSGEVIRIVS